MTTDLPLEGFRILVVEDDYLLAEILVDMLIDQGAKVIGPYGRLNEAMDAVSKNNGAIDCALLDINLHGEKSFPIADALSEREIPFVFATGYGGEAIPEAYRAQPRCEKPFNQSVLVATIAACRAGNESRAPLIP